MAELRHIEDLCPPGITAAGFGVLAIDLSAIVAVKGSEPGMVAVYLYGAPPIRFTASCADRWRYPAQELAAAIVEAANGVRRRQGKRRSGAKSVA